MYLRHAITFSMTRQCVYIFITLDLSWAYYGALLKIIQYNFFFITVRIVYTQ